MGGYFVRCWVISGNPAEGPVFEYFQDAQNFGNWSISVHKKVIHVGDKIAFWMTGSDRGFYLFAEVAREPYQETHWRAKQREKKMKGWYIDLRKQKSIHTNPILGTDLAEREDFRRLIRTLTSSHKNPTELTIKQWNFLQKYAQKPGRKLSGVQAVAIIEGELEARAEVLIRKTQGKFRKLLLANREMGTCLLCGREMSSKFLIAAHIKPWSKCKDSERRNYSAGMMLACRFGCDYLFEAGQIGVNSRGILVENRRLTDVQAIRYIKKYLGRKVSLNREQRIFFDWHFKNQFNRSG